jgi:glycosyltransferase involved in cell wall biosynthesis
MKVAFYAPMKSPFHSVPSGDRRVACLLMDALQLAGYDTQLASEFRSYEGTGDLAAQKDIEHRAQEVADALIEKYSTLAADARPQLWFTYHLYHKAPDWLGPKICKALDIPYFVAEASHAPKQKGGKWDLGYHAAEQAIRSADRIFHMTSLDGECLKPLARRQHSLVHLPPFIETDFPPATPDEGRRVIKMNGGREDKVTLLSVAMMRSGDKFHSYQQLSQMLTYLPTDGWQLVIVGDGHYSDQVRALFTQFESRIIYLGIQTGDALQSIYATADLYVWPACGEAFGMAFLEAQRQGTPVVAGDVRGVPDVVLNGRTGKLVAGDDVKEMAVQVSNLMADEAQRHVFSRAARDFVLQERSLSKAAEILSNHIKEICK